MNRTSLTRRLIAGVASLLVGGAAAVALAAPAQATDPQLPRDIAYSDVEFVDWCGGTYVFIKSGTVLPFYKWTITVAGEEFWSGTLAAGENTDQAPPLVAPDGGEISVDFKFSPDNGDWPKTHTWTDPGDCEEPDPDPEPEPDPEPDPKPEPEEQLGQVIPDVNCETTTIVITNTTSVEEVLTVVPSVGEPVDVVVPAGTVEEPGASEPVSFPSSEGLIVDVQFEGESVIIGGPIEITSEAWEELGCDDGGEGGELPITGNTTMLIAGGAVALLALGGGMFLVARRRRVTFTA